jgi:hypothetical protein
VNKELEYARTYGKEIFRVLVRGQKEDAVPISLIDLQWIDMRSDYETGILKLINEIRHFLGMDAIEALKQRNKESESDTLKPDVSQNAWLRTGSLFWISYDLQWTLLDLMQGGSPSEINDGFRQCFHHASRLNLADNIVRQLEKLKDDAAQYQQDQDWTPQRRGEYGYYIRDIFNRVAKLAEENENKSTDDGFDPGMG